MEVSKLSEILKKSNLYEKIVGIAKETVEVLVFRELTNDELTIFKNEIISMGGKNLTITQDTTNTIITYTKGEMVDTEQYKNLSEIIDWEFNFISNSQIYHNKKYNWVNINEINNNNNTENEYED